MSDPGYIHPRRRSAVECNGTAAEVRPESASNPAHAHLSRADLEAAVDYWQPRAMAVSQELSRLRAERIKYRRLGFWGRVKWVFGGG